MIISKTTKISTFKTEHIDLRQLDKKIEAPTKSKLETDFKFTCRSLELVTNLGL